MTATVAPQSRSPTLAEVIRIAMESHSEDLHVALPARITEIDLAAQKVSVQPLIKRVVGAEDGQEINETMPVITDVPLVLPRSSNFFLSFPLAVGDHVLLIVIERSIDAWASGAGGITDPGALHRHDLTDAIAVPGLWPFSQALKETDASKLVLGKDKGGLQLRIDQLIELGTKAGTLDFVALAQKVLTELLLVQADFVAMLTAINTHVHNGITVGVGTDFSGPPTPPIVYVPHTPASVAALKTKAE